MILLKVIFDILKTSICCFISCTSRELKSITCQVPELEHDFFSKAVQANNGKDPEMLVKNLSECCLIISLVVNFFKSKLYNVSRGFLKARFPQK